MKDKHPKEKRVSWGEINYGRYSITDKDDSNDQVADSDSTLPKAVDTMNLKNMDNHILLEESIRLEDHNPFLEENKSNLDKKESVKPIENFDKNLTNKISNPHQPKNEETIISSSVKHKIDFFEQKTANPDQSVQKKEENTTVLLNTSTFDICFPNENMSGEMDTKKFNEIFKCSKLTQENLEENYNEDVMNTVNMKHLLNMAPFNPIDELIKRGIRFYISDKIFFKRTSVYLSSQRSHPKLYYFNKYFNKPLCDFYNNFIQTLLNLHEKIKDEHLRLAKLINQEMFNKENIDSLLFELKGLSSTIYKISWYNLCKKEEFQFYNLIKENKNKIEDEFVDLKKEKERKIESIRNKEEKLKKLQERLSTNTKNCNFSSEKEDINLTHLEKMVQDSKSVNESYQREIQELTEKVSENLILFNNLNLKITKYKEEINELNLKIKNKSINEKDYLEIRDKFKKICSISGLEILKASENIFNIKVGEYICEFIISPGNILLIDDYTISTNNKENRSLILFFISNLNLKNETLRNAISKILEINVKVKSILKDVNSIKFNSIISYNEGNDCLIIKIKKFNKKIEEKEIILKIKKDFSKEVMINNEIIMVSDYGYMSEAFKYI